MVKIFYVAIIAVESDMKYVASYEYIYYSYVA